jgi:DNA-binding CsgD family transcriptional regulator
MPGDLHKLLMAGLQRGVITCLQFDLLKLVGQGHTIDEAGRAHGLKRWRVYHLVVEAKRILRREVLGIVD